jgi:hypothetical protein
MTRMEKVELALIALVVAAAWLLAGDLVWTPRFGKVVCYSAALLLAQGLLRDFARLAFVRRSGEKRRIGCLCAESTIGLLFVAIGVGLTLVGISDEVPIGRGALAALLGGILGVGFIAKDYVVSIRKEKDHASVVVW